MLLTESRLASAIGADKKISFTAKPLRTTATTAMIT
jgi:hypothetical protein